MALALRNLRANRRSLAPLKWLRLRTPRVQRFASSRHETLISKAASKARNPAVTKENFYDYYLSYPRRKAEPFSPAAGLLSLNSKTCRDALPPNLQPNPLVAFLDKSISFETATKCLEAYIAGLHSSKRPKDELRRHYVNDRPGKWALLWLFQSNGFNSVDFMLHPRFSRAMTFCLVAEGRSAEEYIWRWVHSNHKPSGYPAAQNESTHEFYKANLFRGVLEAKAYWGPDDNPMEDPLLAFEKILGIYRNLGIWVSINSIGQWVSRALHTEVHKLVHPELFDQFIDSLVIWIIPLDERLFNVARLMLLHPTKPTAVPFLHFFRFCARPMQHSVFVQDLLNSESPTIRTLLFTSIIETAQKLNSDGMTEEARWVLDSGRQVRPDLIGEENNFKFLRVPQHLRGQVRYEASDSDIAKGAEVDAEGSVVRKQGLHQRIYQTQRAMDEMWVAGKVKKR